LERKKTEGQRSVNRNLTLEANCSGLKNKRHARARPPQEQSGGPDQPADCELLLGWMLSEFISTLCAEKTNALALHE
jgi:hypothetical protein